MQRAERIVVADADALALAAAERLARRAADAQGPIAICLTGGSTPRNLYRLLTRQPWRGAVPWSRIHWFWGDERFVPADDERSNAAMARAALLDHVPAAGVHPIPVATCGPDEAARLYEDGLKRFYGADRLDPARPLFDLVLMGMGGDGHTASLFPSAPALDEDRRWVVGVPSAGLAPFVPRVTLTFPALASSREMLFLVSGAEKRDALARIDAGEDLPAARARSDGTLVWLIDKAACGADG